MTLQVAALLAGLALTFGVAAQALAYEEIEIEYETSNGKTIVDVSYELAGVEKDSKFTYFTTDLDEVWEELSDELDLSVEDIESILDGTYGVEEGNRADAEEAIEDAEFALEEAVYEIEDVDDVDEKAELQGYYDTAEEYLEKAEEAFDFGKYADAEEWAEKAEEKVEDYILKSSSSDNDESEDEDNNKGHGNDDDKCDDDNPGNSDKCDDDKYEDNDKSSDFSNFGKSTDRVELQKQLQLLLTLLIQLLQGQL